MKRMIGIDGKRGKWRVATAVGLLLGSLAGGQASAGDTTISFRKPARHAVLTIRIENEDNPPLPITAVTLQAVTDRIVFEDDGQGPYRLLYGNEEAGMPRYDLAYFKDHIEGEGPVDGALGSLIVLQEERRPPWWNTAGKGVFQAALVAVALAMIVIVLTVLRKSDKEKS